MAQPYTPQCTEIRFVLRDVLHWERLVALPQFAHVDVEVVTDILEAGSKFCLASLGPLNTLGDHLGCTFDSDTVSVPDEFTQAFRQFSRDGWLGLDQPEAYGGQGLPYTLSNAVSEMVNGACVAFGMMPCMSKAAVELLLQHASADIQDQWVPLLLSGEVGATIAITEPQAGSDVRSIKTQATRQDDGSYLISGTKAFITCGDQNYTQQILHFVLAKEKCEGEAAELTLFMVPKNRFDNPQQRNSVFATGVEAKMGLKASPTCSMAFDKAQGIRLGVTGKGLNTLFTMMNLMRMEVAIQSVGIASAATQKARLYAAQRTQGGDPSMGIEQFADVQRMLNEMSCLTEGMRVLALDVSMQADLSKPGVPNDYVEFLLPVCKAWMSDQAFRVANLGIQVHGGYGYITESGIEQYARDSRALSIYEGANGIQALDLVLRKLIKNKGRGYFALKERIEKTLIQASQQEILKPLVTEFRMAFDRLERITDTLSVASQTDARIVATPYLNLVGTVLCGWAWLRIVMATDEGTPLFIEKIQLAAFYMDNLLPDTMGMEYRITQSIDPLNVGRES